MRRLAAVVFFMPSVAIAQATADLARQIDSLVIEQTQVRTALNAYDQLHPRSKVTWTDSIRAAGGKLTIFMNANTLDIGRATAAAVDSALAPVRDAIGAFAPIMFSVRRDTLRSFDRRNLVIVGYMPTREGSINVDSPADAKAIARLITDRIVGVAIDSSKSDFGKWRKGRVPIEGAEARSATDWGALRLDLISSPSLLGRRCFDGNIAACKSYLGLLPVEDPVTAWYDSLARFREVSANRDLSHRFKSAATTRCLAHSDADCVLALRAMAHLIDAPGDDSARATVMRQAVVMGGAGAVERLLMSKGSASDALSAAANAPIDSVVDTWRRQVRGGALEASNMSMAVAVIALGWAVILFGLSLRSSRWP